MPSLVMTPEDYLDPVRAMNKMVAQINANAEAGGGGGQELDALTARVAALEAAVAGIVPGSVHYVRVLTNDNALNAAVPNGGVLQYDTIDHDTDGFVAHAAPFSAITIPEGLGGVYVINGWSSGSGSQSTSLGMGVRLNSDALAGTNQTIFGPAVVNYTLDNAAIAILQLSAGDTVELFNTSVSNGTNVFTAVFLSLVRIEPGLVRAAAP